MTPVYYKVGLSMFTDEAQDPSKRCFYLTMWIAKSNPLHGLPDVEAPIRADQSVLQDCYDLYPITSTLPHLCRALCIMLKDRSAQYV